MATLLQPHLDKQSLSYKEAVEAINDRDNVEEILEALGNFIIATISLTTHIPVYIIYLTSEKMKDAGTMCTITKFGAKTEYLFRKDCNKAMTPHRSLVIMVYNGIDYYAPTIPRQHFCDLCTYSCHSRATLHNHINCDYPEETGAMEPKCWRCSKCAKIFKLANGYHGHDCTKKKKRRGRKLKGASAAVSIPSEKN